MTNTDDLAPIVEDDVRKPLIQWFKAEDGEGTFKIVYKLSEKMSLEQVKEFVAHVDTHKVVMVGDDHIEEGKFEDLWARHGNNMLPFRTEGLFHMWWRQFHRGTQEEEYLIKPVEKKKKDEQETLVETQYIYCELFEPNVQRVRAYKGSYPIGSAIMFEGVSYQFCRDKEGDESIEIPPSIKVLYFQDHIQPLVGKLHEATTYKQGSFGYAAQYYERHEQMMKKILMNIPREWLIVEPGCGVGLVGRSRDNVICGDLYPPQGCLGIVKKETVSQTLRRGMESGDIPKVFVCSYVHCFMTPGDLDMIRSERVIWVDAPMHRMMGIEVYPGITFQNLAEPFFPREFLQERDAIRLTLSYTENLINGRSYLIASENEYVAYLRAMRPHIPLEMWRPQFDSMHKETPRKEHEWALRSTMPQKILYNEPEVTTRILEDRQHGKVYRADIRPRVPEGDYKGSFISQCTGAERALASTLEELIMFLDHGVSRVYFAPVGREITHFFTEDNIIGVNGDTQVYYEFRQVYKVAATDQLWRSYFGHFPSKVIGPWFYFYDQKDEGDIRQMKFRTPIMVMNGELIPRVGVDRVSDCELALVGNRVYAKIADWSIPMRFDGSYVTMLYVLRTVFRHRVSKDQIATLLSFSDKVGGKIPQLLRDRLVSYAGTSQWALFLQRES